MENHFIFTLGYVHEVIFEGREIRLEELPMGKVKECYEFLKEFAAVTSCSSPTSPSRS